MITPKSSIMPQVKSALEAQKSNASMHSVRSVHVSWKSILASRIRRRIHIFSQETTIHGFRELHKSRKWWQKLIWILAILGCITCFVVQTHIQLKQAMDQRNVVRIRPLSKQEDYPYPNLVLAIPAWVWIDPQKVLNYNITRDQLILIKSFLKGSIDTYDSEYPLDMQKEELNRKAEEMGIDGVGKFFSALARDDAAGLKIYPGYGNGSPVKESLFSVDNCYYVLNTSNAKSTIFGNSYVMRFVFNFTAFYENVNASTVYWGRNEFVNDTKLVSFARSLRPWLLNQDFNGHIYVRPGFLYSMHHTIRIYRPMIDCNPRFNADPLYHPLDCKYSCRLKANLSMNASSCYRFDAIIHRYAPETWPLCSRGFYVNDTFEDYGKDEPEYRNLTKQEMKDRKALVQSCDKKECLPPCAQWLTSANFIATELISIDGHQLDDISLIEIYYPDRNYITVNEEYNSYEWHDLASDVGGLLGLWLGASIMSLCQMLHLFAWAPENG